MLNRKQILLLFNVGLFVYSTVVLMKSLVSHNNVFGHFFTQITSIFQPFTQKIWANVMIWQNLVYLLIFCLLLYLLWRFWRATFVFFEIVATLLILDYIILYIQHAIGLEKIFEIAVMLVCLFNIWQNSSDLKKL